MLSIISIHAPRAGCDRAGCAPLTVAHLISIHAPRAGCDAQRYFPKSTRTYFNPRTPCGVRHRGAVGRKAKSEFQSTHPVRGATAQQTCGNIIISDFNPRTPCGVRRALLQLIDISKDFNPRTPCGVRQRKSAENPSDYCLSFTKLLYLPAFSRRIRKRQAAQNAIFRCEAPGESMCTSGSHLRSGARLRARRTRGHLHAPPWRHSDSQARKTAGCPFSRRSRPSARP